MTNLQRLSAVRDAVGQWFANHAAVDEDSSNLIETLLIRDGFYCGRRFQLGDCSAIWFAEEQQVKFYDATGQFVESSQEAEIRRAA